jgi:hypothetical protein
MSGEHEESRIVQNKSPCVWELTRENNNIVIVDLVVYASCINASPLGSIFSCILSWMAITLSPSSVESTER